MLLLMCCVGVVDVAAASVAVPADAAPVLTVDSEGVISCIGLDGWDGSVTSTSPLHNCLDFSSLLGSISAPFSIIFASFFRASFSHRFFIDLRQKALFLGYF